MRMHRILRWIASFLLFQISELFMEGVSLQDVYNLTCNATAWRELFWFPPSTNVTALTSLICTLNEKEAEQFMATLMMVNINRFTFIALSNAMKCLQN